MTEFSSVSTGYGTLVMISQTCRNIYDRFVASTRVSNLEIKLRCFISAPKRPDDCLLNYLLKKFA